MRTTLLLMALVVLAGCTTPQLSHRPADFPSAPSSSPVPVSVAPVPHESFLTLERSNPEVSSLLLTLQDSPLVFPTAAEEGPRDAEASNSPHVESLFTRDYWSLVGQDIQETFTAPARWQGRDWIVAGSVAAGIGVVAGFDRDIQKAVQRNRNGTVNSIFDAVEPFGNEYAPGIVGAFYLGGVIFKDARAKSVALDSLSASIIASGLIIQPLKYGLGRNRPSDNRGAYYFQPFGGRDSFPSGHATEAFTLATVVAEHYDSLWVKIGAYGLASMIGYARINNNAHWASDVMAGAAIGTFVGHVVVRFNQSHRKLSIQPLTGPDIQGAQFSILF